MVLLLDQSFGFGYDDLKSFLVQSGLVGDSGFQRGMLTLQEYGSLIGGDKHQTFPE